MSQDIFEMYQATKTMSFKDVLRHIWSVHEGRKCPICFIDSKNRTYYKEHLLSVHGEKLEKKVERPSCRKVLLVNKQDLKDTPKPVHEDKNQKENTNLSPDVIENQGPENFIRKKTGVKFYLTRQCSNFCTYYLF